MIADRVKEFSTSTGTGALTLSGAVTAYESFNAAFGIGPSFDYCIETIDDATGMPTGSWEIGSGHLSGATTLVRDTVQQSSNADALVPFGAGTKNVFCTLPASAINALQNAVDAKVDDTGDTMTGDLTIAKTDPALTLNKTASGDRSSLFGSKGGLTRWRLDLGNSTGEGGANAGSDFTLSRYNDAGVVMSTVLTADRSAGLLTVTGDPTAALGIATKQYADAQAALKVAKAGDTMTGDLAITKASPVLKLNKTASGQEAIVRGELNGLPRWAMVLGEGTAEGGGNLGSDFIIFRYDNSGGWAGYPFAINRATGNVSISTGTASTSSTTGALTVAGGVGIGGYTYAAGDIVQSRDDSANPVVHQITNLNASVSLSAGIQLKTGANTNVWQMGVKNGTLYFGVAFVADYATFSSTGNLTLAGGLAVGSPTGGNKGAGTVNATAVYDDNVLLTCFGTQYAARGAVDLAQWDAVSPTGKHKLAHKFVDMLKSFDPRNPKQYIKRMLEDEALPGMPTIHEWRHGGASLGEMHNRLWLATELLASAFVGLHNDYETRLAALMQRVETLEKRT